MLMLSRSYRPIYELDEVVVVVDGRGDGGVVLVPLSAGEGAILIGVAEVLEELHEDLVFGHFALLDLGVEFAVVHTSGDHSLSCLPQVVCVDGASAVSVEFQKSLINDGLAAGIRLSADRHQELVEIDAPIVVLVQRVKEHIELVGGEVHLAVSETGHEFLAVDLVVAVKRVHLTENAAETTDRLVASLLELRAHILEA